MQALNVARQKWTPRTGSLRCPACHHVSYRAETLQRHLTGCCPDLFEAEVRARRCLISSIHGRFRHLTTPLSCQEADTRLYTAGIRACYELH